MSKTVADELEAEFRRAEKAERRCEALLAVATGSTPHVLNGLCPDAATGPHSRDPDCPACRVLGLTP